MSQYRQIISVHQALISWVSFWNIPHLCSMEATHSSCHSTGRWPSAVRPAGSSFYRGSGCQSRLHIPSSGRPPRSPAPRLEEAGSILLKEWEEQIIQETSGDRKLETATMSRPSFVILFLFCFNRSQGHSLECGLWSRPCHPTCGHKMAEKHHETEQ